jgi:glycerate 2-kinase
MTEAGAGGSSDVVLGRARARALFDAALRAVDPARAVTNALDLRAGSIIAGETPVLAPLGVHVVAVGKAAVPMTQGALQVLDGHIRSGDVITKEGHADGVLPGQLRVHEAGHPIPDERGVAATSLALDALRNLPDRMVVLALVSGGGSALLEAPIAGVTLSDLATTTDLLLRAGAPIEALNAVRAPLSRVKAGGLRAAAPGAAWVTLVMSDVLGNDPRVIASGPTVAGRRDPNLALDIIDRYGARGQIPGPVLAALNCGSAEPEPVNLREDLLLVIGDNASAVGAAANEARALDLNSRIVWSAAQGEAAHLGRSFVSVAAEAPQSIDVILGGGEATVTVRGDGRGGRNTEFALAAALELERRQIRDWLIASLATDGQDATTGLAGAIADAATPQRARSAGVDPDLALATNDSATVFEVAGGAVATGPTGTNVNDLYLAVRLGDRLRQGRKEGD